MTKAKGTAIIVLLLILKSGLFLVYLKTRTMS